MKILLCNKYYYSISYLKFKIIKRLLSKGGQVYSFGKSNECGELGLGDNLPRNVPCLVTKLRLSGEKINSVSCGFKHVICKSGLGKVFIWGSAILGQLGLGNFENQFLPRQINLEKQTSNGVYKVLQAKAGKIYILYI